MLVLAGITAGIYLFVNPKGNGFTSYTVDKYSDVTDWCETNLKEGKLVSDCKALLINIDSNSCFEVKVITKNKELKDFTVCEKNDTLTYTNDVLGYKKLMPVNMVFTYTKEGILGDYSFSNVSFGKADDTYIQSIVNEDIANLVTIDPSSTTIENSVDFCPRPETLPSYVTDANRTAYTEYFNKNIMAKEKYFDGYMYNWDDSTIRILFACDSAENMGYTDVCDKTKIQGKSQFPDDSVLITSTLTAKEDLDPSVLKEISLIYDNMFLMESMNNMISLNLLASLNNRINSAGNVNNEIICSITKIYDNLFFNDPKYNIGVNNLHSIITANAPNFLCIDNFSDEKRYDVYGLYLKAYYSNRKVTDLYISYRCRNLIKYLSSN
jgi:hypothetical protein